jgi:hypothetical protein
MMKSTRRAFVAKAAALSALPIAPLSWGKEAAKPAAAKAAEEPKPAPPDGLARLAHERYGKHLSQGQLPLLDEKIAGIERNGARLRAFKLKNGDEPVADFRAVRP